MSIPNELPPQPANCPNDLDGKPTTEPMPDNQFNNIVRAINKNASLANVQQIEVVLADNLARLGMRQRVRMAVTGVPDGSDSVDPQSLYAWAAKVERHDADACRQIQVLHATAARRLGG